MTLRLSGPLFGAAACAIIANAHVNPRVEGDTQVLLRGTVAAVVCLDDGERPCSDVAHFPALQYLELAAMGRAGVGVDTALELLALLSGLASAWLLLVGVGALAATGRTTSGLVFALALVGSPFWFYSASTFGEAQAAALTFGVVWAVVMGKGRWWVALFVFAAGLTKETAPPLLFALATFAVPLVERAERWAMLAPSAVAASAAFAVNGCFNVFRYGSPWNSAYLDPLLQVPLDQHAVNALALLFSPTSGIAVSFPLALAVVINLGVMLTAARRGWPRATVYLGAVALLAVLVVGFARWFTPFGWVSWGPRFLVPWVPAILFLLLWRYEAEVRNLVGLMDRRAFVVVALVAVALGVAQLGAAYEPEAITAWFHGTSVDCIATIQGDPAWYFICFNRLAWHPTVGLVSSVARAALVNHPVLTCALTIAHLGLWRWLWTTPRKFEAVRKLLASIEGEGP